MSLHYFNIVVTFGFLYCLYNYVIGFGPSIPSSDSLFQQLHNGVSNNMCSAYYSYLLCFVCL